MKKSGFKTNQPRTCGLFYAILCKRIDTRKSEVKTSCTFTPWGYTSDPSQLGKSVQLFYWVSYEYMATN